MKTFESKQYVVSLKLIGDRVAAASEYPFSLPALRGADGLQFTTPVTFLIGENGVGKSTLLEAIAIAYGFNPEGGSRNFNFASRESHSILHSALRLVKSARRPRDGFFLRAESFYNVATEVERLGVSHSYGDRELHEQSHGESFMSLVTNRFRGKGLYLLDEPEAALSPTRQLALLVRLKQLVEDDSQFIIATHSPILMAFPGARILEITDREVASVRYEETEHFQITRRFLNNPEGMLDELMGR
ncbi:MAG TPA: AAA family ATPase [Gemmatimonadaceae bacterium]|nr:AAA family ATPase [Gemmatimonadaceae bacterium]